MRISDWSSDVCSSDLRGAFLRHTCGRPPATETRIGVADAPRHLWRRPYVARIADGLHRRGRRRAAAEGLGNDRRCTRFLTFLGSPETYREQSPTIRQTRTVRVATCRYRVAGKRSGRD